MQLLWTSVLWDYRVGHCGCFYSLMRKQSLFSSIFFSDRGGLHSIPKCPWGRMMMCCSSTFHHLVFVYLWDISYISFVSRNDFTIYTVLFLNLCYIAFWGRCWAEKAPFLSSSSRSLGVTGSRGLTMRWVTQWKQNSRSLSLRTPAPSWNVTQQLRSSGNTSWERLATLSQHSETFFLHNVYIYLLIVILKKQTIHWQFKQVQRQPFMKTQLLRLKQRLDNMGKTLNI